ncbi:glutamate receptor-interacting protein 1 isoform X2 [Eurosta solidaginis]|uniref:glutamate receptor-interacting protein 1 isoform X2 n=1 Tax=Eurosta solidaginis TaxID=178769 RepID=UPI003530A692
MKLWKAKKPISCVPGKPATLKNEDKAENVANVGGIPLTPIVSVDRAMSPAQSEDSGLAPDRGTTYATITLPRDSSLNMGITFAVSQNSLCVTSKLAQITVERESGCLGLTLRGGGDYPLIVTHVRPHGPVYKTGRIKPGDRLLRVDNLSLIGKTLAEAQQIIKCGGHVSGYTNLTVEYDVSVVQNVEFSMGPLLIEIERPMNDKLGLVLCNYPASSHVDSTKIDEVSAAGVYIASIMPASIADRCGALSVGDQVLSIDDTIIENSAYSPDEVMTMLDANTSRGFTQMQIMPAHALTRRGHTMLGSPKYGFNTLESRKSRQRQRYIRKSSLPLDGGGGGGSGGSAANVGGGGGSTGSNSGTASNASGGSSASGSTTGVNSSASSSGVGSGSIGIGGGCGGSGGGGSSNMNMVGVGTLHHHPSAIGICRSETFPVLLDCSQGSGIVLGPPSACGRAVTIIQVLADSVADRSGSIQKGDRIVAINKMYNLDIQTMRQLLGETRTLQSQNKQQSPAAANWLELEIEIDMADSVVPSSGVYNVKLLRAGKSGLGISVNGSSHGGFVIADVKPGSPAHRTGSLRGGDILLAVDNHPVQHYNVDSLLKDSSSSLDFTTLTVKRVMLPDFLFDAQQKMPSNHIYSNCPASPSEHDLYSTTAYVTSKFNDCLSLKSTTPQPDFYHSTSVGMDDGCSLQSVQMRHHPHACNTWSAQTSAMGRSFAAQNTQSLTTELPDNEDSNYQDFTCYDLDRYASADCSALPPPMENKVYGSATSSSSKSSGSSLHQIIFNVRLEPKGGLLGITLAGSEDISKPITISGLVEGGIAHKHGQIQVGDQLLAINEDSIQGMPLSHATNILQNLGDIVDLKILRAHEISSIMAGGAHLDGGGNMPQPQAIYAKVQRRPRSPSSNTDVTSTSGAGNKDGKHRVFHVTLKKDKVYDDYGFSVSDGLYERGVFINRIRSGGPADLSGLLKPFDRIMQVNEMKTQDFDCCLTVPLIAAAGDKIELIIQRTE